MHVCVSVWAGSLARCVLVSEELSGSEDLGTLFDRGVIKVLRGRGNDADAPGLMSKYETRPAAHHRSPQLA